MIVTRAGRLREWSQEELRLYSNLETFALGAPTWRPEPNRNISHWVLLREFNVHICPQIHLRGTRESEPIFEPPAEMSDKTPLSAIIRPRDTRRDTKLTLSPTKKNHAICFRSHKSLHYHPQGIFLKKRVCDTFYTLCDIRFCQSISKRTKENVNHYNNQSQLKIHGYFWHNDIKRVCDSFCDIMSCQKNKNKKKKKKERKKKKMSVIITWATKIYIWFTNWPSVTWDWLPTHKINIKFSQPLW